MSWSEAAAGRRVAAGEAAAAKARDGVPGSGAAGNEESAPCGHTTRAQYRGHARPYTVF